MLLVSENCAVLYLTTVMLQSALRRTTIKRRLSDEILMKYRSFLQRYCYIAISFVLALLLASVFSMPILFVQGHSIVRDDEDDGDTWEGWSWVSHEGGHLSGNMAISTTKHNFGIRNTLPSNNWEEAEANEITVIWECQNHVKRINGGIDDEMKRLGTVTIPGGGYAEYEYSHLNNTCDWISQPGDYILRGYTAVRIPGDGAAETLDAVHPFTIPE